jgi:hypothetical protein
VYGHFGVDVKEKDIYEIFDKFGIEWIYSPHKKGLRIYNDAQVKNLRTMERSGAFLQALIDHTDNGNDVKPFNNDTSGFEPNYRNGENDEEAYSQHLINDVYPFEGKKVRMTMEQFHRLKKRLLS